MLKIGAIIRKQRLSLGLTQSSLGEQLDVSAPAISKWEQGQSYPDIELLPRLARVLQLDMNALLAFHSALTPEDTRQFSTNLAQKSGFAAYEFASAKLKEYPHAPTLRLMANAWLVTQKAAMTTAEWTTTATFIEGNYLRVMHASDLSQAQQAALMLFHFYLNEERFADAQTQLSELSDAVIAYNALKPEMSLRQGDVVRTYQVGEDLLLQNVAGITRVLSILIKNALNDHNVDYARACLAVGQALTEQLAFHDAFLSDAAIMIAKATQSSQLVADTLIALINQLKAPAQSPVLVHHQVPVMPQSMSKIEIIQMSLAQFKADPELAFAWADPRLQALLAKYEVK